MTDIKLDSITSDDMNNDFFKNINNIVNLNSDSDNAQLVNQPILTQPTQPTQPQPIQPQPILTQPTQPILTQPIQTQPILTQPIQTQPILTQPIQTRQTQPIQTRQTQPIQNQIRQNQIRQPQVRQTQQTQIKNDIENKQNEKSVTFNDKVEEKEITPIDNTKNIINNTIMEIKKIKIGKLLVPQTTLFFTIILIVLSIGLFYATKPKPKEEDDDELTK